MENQKITVSGLTIKVSKINDNDYVSLTDIAKYKKGATNDTIRYWMKNSSTIQFLWYWEELHNSKFGHTYSCGRNRPRKKRNLPMGEASIFFQSRY